eukprot:362408-Amorphochlora_amoeboformis.AAC.1
MHSKAPKGAHDLGSAHGRFGAREGADLLADMREEYNRIAVAQSAGLECNLHLHHAPHDLIADKKADKLPQSATTVSYQLERQHTSLQRHEHPVGIVVRVAHLIPHAVDVGVARVDFLQGPHLPLGPVRRLRVS